MTAKAGFIGLGAMGLPMARNLHRAGLLAAAWNRTPEKAAALAAENGCLHSDGPAALAAAVDVVVLCVSADEDVLGLAGDLAPGLAEGKVVVDCSTVSAQTAREAAERVAEAGAGFLDCPVSGGTEGARQGTLSIMAGGSVADLGRARPVLEAMGRRIVHLGPRPPTRCWWPASTRPSPRRWPSAAPRACRWTR